MTRLTVSVCALLVTATATGHARSPAMGPDMDQGATAIRAEIVAARPQGTPALLIELLSLRQGDGASAGSTNTITELRTSALREAALRVGTQAGVSWRYEVIVAMLKAKDYERRLDAIYNFGPLMLHDVIAPPVIRRIENTYRKIDDDTARSVRVGYRLEHPARIVTVPPTWRDFLVRRFPPPERPADILLPQNDAEAELWERYVWKGWRDGVGQAERIFEVSLNLLTATYLGMIQYQTLHTQGIVSAPNLATTGLRITMDGRKLNVGEVVYRITSHSEFQDPGGWQPIPYNAESAE